ncbi:hypothetical protein [Kaistia sp. MMO-174]|uniref:hypothetical protein n=1 Tax=Kaistia sp. MMO-174 TaxID=3081256 RepID=UPI003019B692
MGKVIKNLFGGSSDAEKLAREQAASQQRTQLAAMANQQAEVDQAKASSTGRKGRQLLTFLGGGDGTSTLG